MLCICTSQVGASRFVCTSETAPAPAHTQTRAHTRSCTQAVDHDNDTPLATRVLSLSSDWASPAGGFRRAKKNAAYRTDASGFFTVVSPWSNV